jgi:hypothetical protein
MKKCRQLEKIPQCDVAANEQKSLGVREQAHKQKKNSTDQFNSNLVC